MSAPRNPSFGPIEESSIPPLDSHLKTLANNKTRIGKVYDYLLGDICRMVITNAVAFKAGAFSSALIGILAETEHVADLPNRKRLIELIEAAMPNEPVRYKPSGNIEMFEGRNMDTIPDPFQMPKEGGK
jgi:hypothetical protein